MLKFADDTKIYSKINNAEDGMRLQDDRDRLVRWFEEWKMFFNTGKCKVIHFGRSLGLDVSSDLKVSSQCQQAYSKANIMLGLTSKNIYKKSRTVMLQLYKTLVRPHVEYCTVAWSPYYQKFKEQIEKIHGMKGMPYERRLRNWVCGRY